MYRKYLVKNPSNSSFYFRSYIPLDLRDLYQGKIEFRVSLEKSSDRKGFSSNYNLCGFYLKGSEYNFIYEEIKGK